MFGQLLIDIRRARKTFDTSQSERKFGPIVIDFRQVQVSISNKYDYWHKEILFNFGGRLGNAMVSLYVRRFWLLCIY